MPDSEKVINGLEKLRKDLGYGLPDRSDVVREYLKSLTDAITLLEEQEPVKPNLDVDEWMCGNCGHKLEHQELLGDNMLFHEQYNYCPNCGRKVKWDA